jgi:hypothetical protein
MSDIVTHDGADALMGFIERASRDPDFDVAKFESLLRMRRELQRDIEQREYNAAMAAAQSEMEPIVRDATNTHLRNRYARLEKIDAGVRPVYTRHGFSVSYGSEVPAGPNLIRITCTVAHRGGFFKTEYLDSELDATGTQGGRSKTPIQAVGSSVTYLRRYLLCMVFNIMLADEDDDGDGRKAQTLASLRATFAEIGVSARQLEVRQRRAMAEFTPDDVGGLRVVYAEIKRGATTANKEFPPLDAFEAASAGVVADSGGGPPAGSTGAGEADRAGEIAREMARQAGWPGPNPGAGHGPGMSGAARQAGLPGEQPAREA